ncbi:hypothetical protein [Croceivirga thetidis]|uniref:Uncharacterized protein n=1 Tax=Croceivirga thetidis TaxID=2721623 RepID=A0ABX1GWZ6_9FLAO|nr:hypothetical protein [Croceivirga thetidis]NKI33460.1 hypothetical protein [Croceivirga thetidis]
MEQNKELEELLDKMFASDKLDSPSMGFTNQVLGQIEAIESSKIKFKPLIPKWFLVVFGAVISIFVWYSIKTNQSSTDALNFVPRFDVNTVISDFFNQFNLSSSLGYSLLAIGMVSCVQAILFTRKMNRRII